MNKISSAEQAISALMKLKARSIPIRVNLSFPHTVFSFTGLITSIDKEGLEIVYPQQSELKWDFAAPRFHIAPLSKFGFGGQLDEGESAISLTLSIVRLDQPDDPRPVRIHLHSEWPPPSEHSKKVH